MVREEGIHAGLHLNLTEGPPTRNLEMGEVNTLVDQNGQFLGKQGFRDAMPDINFDHLMKEIDN